MPHLAGVRLCLPTSMRGKSTNQSNPIGSHQTASSPPLRRWDRGEVRFNQQSVWSGCGETKPPSSVEQESLTSKGETFRVMCYGGARLKDPNLPQISTYKNQKWDGPVQNSRSNMAVPRVFFLIFSWTLLLFGLSWSKQLSWSKKLGTNGRGIWPSFPSLGNSARAKKSTH